ncbi:MAG: hypothetical protein ACRDLD_06525 [Thermoleophilaceae bacterium]
MARERGQATIEWIGLLLAIALVLGALAELAAPRRSAEDHDLGKRLAARIAAPLRVGSGPSLRSGRQRLSRAGPMAPPPRTPPAPPPRARLAPPPRARSAPPLSRTRVADAFRRLRGVERVARRAWIVCLGYRRFRYELEHPRGPNEPLPLDEALRIADTCLNPYAYLVED